VPAQGPPNADIDHPKLFIGGAVGQQATPAGSRSIANPSRRYFHDLVNIHFPHQFVIEIGKA